MPSVETRLPLLLSEGVGKGRISLQQFVALTATNPARLYGLYPRKGTIAIGADADPVLWDAEREVAITNSMLHHAADCTPYEGIRVRGWPKLVLSRGEAVMRDGDPLGAPGRGQYLRCDPPQAAAPRGRPMVDPALF